MTSVLQLFNQIPSSILQLPTLFLLFDCHLADSSLFNWRKMQISHLRIYHGNAYGADKNDDRSVLEQWKSWTAIFESSETDLPLRVLYLPTRSPSPRYHDAGIVDAVKQLVETCRRRDIEVVQEDQPTTSEFEPQFSSNATRRSELRRREAEGGSYVGRA